MTFVLDAYAARSCPLKTVHAFTPSLVAPSITPPTPPFFRDSAAIEAEVIERLRSGGSDLLDLRPTRDLPNETAVAACLEGLQSGVAIIIGGLLPPDETAHRIGRPSLLVHDGSGYLPVQLKFHRVLESAPADHPSLSISRIAEPTQVRAAPERQFRWATRPNAVLQLAHYWRLLEAAGFAAATPRAGLIGIDRLTLPSQTGHEVAPVITWLDLSDRQMPPDPRWVEVPADAQPVSPLERYDREHAYRVELAETALASSGQTTLLTPIVSRECRGCVWQEHCQAQLDADDLSLRISKAPLDVHEVRTLRRLGIGTITEFAEIDLEALLAEYLPRASHREGSEDRLRRAHRRAQMIHAGMELERTTEGPIFLPRRDLEIDIDIETSADDRVYLWGFWIDDSQAGEPYYRAFSQFRELDATAEAGLAADALRWLRSLTAGRDAAAYHYSDYEVLRITRLASRLDPALGAWAQAATETWFVDLFALIRENFLGANGLGLKVVATAATGFVWRDAQANGLASQGWFAEAVGHEDATIRELARTRVLEYNEDDVRATWHLRQWLRTQD
ncbi:MAG: TM0106 family RecB-like putative nuclease [Propioniciclava sp.]